MVSIDCIPLEITIGRPGEPRTFFTGAQTLPHPHLRHRTETEGEIHCPQHHASTKGKHTKDLNPEGKSGVSADQEAAQDRQASSLSTNPKSETLEILDHS